MSNLELQNRWLAQVQEEILLPDLPICDPHHHLWDDDNNPYLLPELLADLGQGHNVVSTVFVECGSMYRAHGAVAMAPVGETEFVNGVAAMGASGRYGDSRICAGIVGFADLTLGPEVAQVLDAHLARSERFRGVRHAVSWDASEPVRNAHTNPPPQLLADAKFRQGVEQMIARDLTFDAWLFHPQLPELTDLARAYPDLTIVVDHFAGPLGIGPYAGKGDEIFTAWQHDFLELSACPNVFAKLGGLAMPINGHGWHKRDTPATSDELLAVTGRYYEVAIQALGPDRCMFESNFPVDRKSCSYHVLWNAFKKMAMPYSDAERASLFHDTATKVYRLAG